MDEHEPVKKPSGAGPFTRLILLMLPCCFLVEPAVPAAQEQDVLGLFTNDRLVPGNIEIERGLREIFAKSADRNIELFSEFLDTPASIGGRQKNGASN